MAYTGNVTFDNVGEPDPYVVQTPCQRIRIQEHARDTAPTLATYNVRIPMSTSPAIRMLGGEPFERSVQRLSSGANFSTGGYFYPGDKPFHVETVNVAAAVFDVMEE